MAIPRYWAKEIWLAAIEESSGKSPIDPTDDWEVYMGDAQLRNAFNLTNEGLKAQGYKTRWTLSVVKNTNPIDKQIDLLAETTDKIEPLGKTQAIAAKFALKHNS